MMLLTNDIYAVVPYRFWFDEDLQDFAAYVLKSIPYVEDDNEDYSGAW